MVRQLTCFVFAVILFSPALLAGEWPQFRGPTGDGHAGDARLPLNWTETENVRWKTKIPGRGWSSPVIEGNQVWMTTALATPATAAAKEQKFAGRRDAKNLELVSSLQFKAVCVDRETGKVIHQIDLFAVEDPEPINALNSYASPTPVIEAGRLFCHFGSYGTLCLDTQTNSIVWRNHELKVVHQNGPGASPVLWGNLLIANYDGIDHQFVAALDKRTGKTVWKTDRSGKLNERAEMQKAYCTPTIVEDGDPLLISPGADWVYGYDPATGSELWKVAYGELGFSVVPKPVVGHGLAYIITSFMKPRLLAIPYRRGDISPEQPIAWSENKQISKMTSALLVGDELYVVADNGIMTCFDALSGKVHYRERIGGNYSSSPVYASGRIYISSREGETIVVAAGTSFKQIAKNRLDNRIMASPAVAGDGLFLRTESHLYRVED